MSVSTIATPSQEISLNLPQPAEGYEHVTAVVNGLKEKCLEKAEANPPTMKWLLLAVGVSLFIASLAFIVMAFASGSLLLGKIGIALIIPSVLTIAAMALCTSPDYKYVADRVSNDLVEFADREDIALTPDNIDFNREIYELLEKRKEEEAKKKEEEAAAKARLEGDLSETFST